MSFIPPIMFTKNDFTKDDDLEWKCNQIIQFIFEQENYSKATQILSDKRFIETVNSCLYDSYLKKILESVVSEREDMVSFKDDPALLKLIRIAEFLIEKKVDSPFCRLSLAAAYLKREDLKKVEDLLPELIQCRGFCNRSDLTDLNFMNGIEKGKYYEIFFIPLVGILESYVKRSAIGISGIFL